MIKELHLKHVGPAPHCDVDFAERLNIFTGDNGLGKTFLLDVVWWALTGTWAGEPAWPQRGNGQPEINYTALSAIPSDGRASRYDFAEQHWSWPGRMQELPGIFIYAQADNSFAVSDEARNYRQDEITFIVPPPKMPGAFLFTVDSLWNGLRKGRQVFCNGLISDWVSWQRTQQARQRSLLFDADPFALLEQVMKRLSPHPGEMIEPGSPTRVAIDDARDIPTVTLPYGNIPLIHASAGMKRILGLSYLLVWSWYEHNQASVLLNQPPTDRLTLLIDEVESHLHPRWQRSILPALLDVATALNPQMKTQLIVTTHAPLVLASVEPYFDEERDKLLLFELNEQQQVTLEEVPWAKHGDTVGWLVSDIFGLKQARSKEAEQAIEAAEALMRGEDMSTYPDNLRTTQDIHQALLHLLPGHDPFWPRWIVTTKIVQP